MLDGDLIAHLESLATTAGDRVYVVRLDQDTAYPALTIQMVSDPEESEHSGPGGLVDARYQITAWSPDALEAKTLAGEVKAALLGFTGQMGGHVVAFVGYEGGPDGFDPEAGPVQQGGAVGLYQCPRDYTIQYKEA